MERSGTVRTNASGHLAIPLQVTAADGTQTSVTWFTDRAEAELLHAQLSYLLSERPVYVPSELELEEAAIGRAARAARAAGRRP